MKNSKRKKQNTVINRLNETNDDFEHDVELSNLHLPLGKEAIDYTSRSNQHGGA